MSRTILRAITLACLVVVGGQPAHAGKGPKAPSAQERSAAFVADGDEAFERGDYEEAITKYRAAYYGLTPEQRTSYVGSIPVRNAMRAYALLLAERQDRRVLEQQLGFLTEFLESVRGTDGGVTRVGEQVVAQLEQTRAEAEQKLAALAQVVAPPPDPDDEGGGGDEGVPQETSGERSELDDEPEFSVGPEEEDDPLTRPAPLRPLGLGLAIGGGVTAGIGVGVMTGWWTVRRQARAEADATWPEGSPTYQDYLRAQWYRARRFLIAGTVLTGVGVAAAAAGTVILLVQRNRAADDVALGLAPALGPEGTGIQLAGRF